jgi:hypothetical protein
MMGSAGVDKGMRQWLMSFSIALYGVLDGHRSEGLLGRGGETSHFFLKSAKRDRRIGKDIDDTAKKWRPVLEMVEETVMFLKHTGRFMPQPPETAYA